MKESPSYYAVIPANVRYSKEVSDGAKLLFGEITCLCNTKGYCWASNAYFAELYGASNRTISRWISELAAAGFIATLVDSSTANSRKIWLAQPVIDTPKLSNPIDKNVYTSRQKRLHPIDKNVYTSRQKRLHPIDKNVQHNNIVNNKRNKGATDVENPPAPLTENQEADNFSNLEANTTSLQMNAAAGPRAPRPSDKPQGVEFHTDLVKQIGAFYKAYPAQWTDGVKQGPGSRYTNEQLVSMLDDYCSHCFANRNTYATFSQHHGNFIRWIKNQKQFERPTVAALPEKQADVTRFYNQIPVTK